MSIKPVLVTAHSGAEGTAPNSREYLKLALSFDPEVIEVDLNINSNGKRVISHDAPNGGDTVGFDELIQLVHGFQGQMNLDVKNLEVVRGLSAYLGNCGLGDRYFLTGLQFSDIQQVGADISGMRYMVNVAARTLEEYNPNTTECCEELCQRVVAAGAFGININYRLITECLLDAVHAALLKVYVWTVDDEADIRAMIALGVDSITTRSLLLTKQLIGL